MKCNEIQDILLTNYIDNELSGEHRLMIEGHLNQCPQCRAVLQTARSLNEVLSSAEKVALDKQKIWKNITDRLDQDASSSLVYTPVRDTHDRRVRFANLFKPAFAFGVLAALIVAMSYFAVSGKGRLAQTLPEEEQYLATMADEIILAEQNDDFGEDFGTDLEAYFL
jgi:anti-sigma factor RsiW